MRIGGWLQGWDATVHAADGVLGWVERRWVPYSVALLLSGAAVWLTQIHPALRESSFLLGVVAVIVATWRGGLGPGITVAVASAAGNVFVILRSEGTLPPDDAIRLAIFFLATLLVSAMNGDRERADVARDAEHASRVRSDALADERLRLQRITDATLRSPSLGGLFHDVLSRIADGLRVDAVAILLVDGVGGDVLVARAAQGLDGLVERGTRVPLGKGFAGRVAAGRGPVAVEDVGDDDIFHPILRAAGVRSVLGVPLMMQERLAGVLIAGTRRRRRVTAEDLGFLELIAGRIALALDRARLYELEHTARAEAEAALRARDGVDHLKADMTDMVVHDLKNPVLGIAMLARLALRQTEGLSEVHQRCLQQIQLATSEVTRVIQNLLEISRMKEEKMPVAREPVVVGAVAAEVADECRGLADEAGKRLVVSTGTVAAVASADRALTKRVLTNLVVNALRHSDSQEIRVDAAPMPEVGEVVVRVIDHGRGIPVEEQQRIFEKFASIRRSAADTTADTGLGLPFCKFAVERMGGRISLTSAVGASTVFAVTLPMHNP